MKKRKLKQKKKRKEDPAPAPAPPSSSDYSAAGLAALRGAQTALPAELLAESSKRAAEEAAQHEAEEEPAEDTAARARKARVARASSRAATEELDRAVHVEDFDARICRMTMQVMTVWAAALLLKISCPCPAGPTMELRRGSRTKSGGAG